jgi:hypothetical protein
MKKPKTGQVELYLKINPARFLLVVGDECGEIPLTARHMQELGASLLSLGFAMEQRQTQAGAANMASDKSIATLQAGTPN